MLTQSQSILVVHLFSRKKTHQPFNSIYWSPWDLLGISKHEIPIQNHIVFDTINNRGRAKNIENSFVITSNFTMLLIVTYCLLDSIVCIWYEYLLDSVCTIITLRLWKSYDVESLHKWTRKSFDGNFACASDKDKYQVTPNLQWPNTRPDF